MGRYLSLLAIIAVVIVLVVGCGDPVRNDNTVGQVRVMTYNIHHAAGTDGKLDIDRIAEVIRSQDAEIVGLQEVDNNYSGRSDFKDQAKLLAEKLQMHYFYGPAIVSGDPENPNLYGNALLSRFPISEGKVHKLMLQEGQEPRVCIEACVSVNSIDYTIMVTHLDHQKNEVRIRQAQDILAAADSIHGPVILMGDFNCRPPGENASDEWAQRTRPVGLIGEKFQDSFLLAGKNQPGTIGSDRRIDYIFVSSDLADKVRSCRVVRTPLTDVASDHRPVVARIGL